jgi:hypothetical protein
MRNIENLRTYKITGTDETGEEKLIRVEIRRTLQTGEQTLYNIYPKENNSNKVVSYVDGKKYEFNLDSNPQDLINNLSDLFKRGRIQIGEYDMIAAPNAIAKKINALEAKAIVRFERNAWGNKTVVPAALRQTKPNIINNYMDFGDYVLEVTASGPKKKSYSYVTFIKKTDQWLQKVCRQ